LKAASVSNIDELLTALNKAIDAAAKESLKESAQQFSEVKLDLDHTGFALFPVDGKGRWGNTWSVGFWPHFWGMIFSAGLLSLGAPFWFNALRSLAVYERKWRRTSRAKRRARKNRLAHQTSKTNPRRQLLPLPDWPSFHSSSLTKNNRHLYGKTKIP